MDDEQRSLLIRSFSHYTSSPGLELRSDESVLRSAAYRIGILAALRSIKSKSVTGVMITDSGRSVKKNGVRIVDPDGGALIADWEPLADSVANVVDPDELVKLIEEFAKKQNISVDGGQSGEVLLARDTSPSGEALFEAAKQGISSVAGTIFHDMGILTSPQLHWLVHARNKDRKASEHDYFQRLSYSYRCLVDLIPEGAKTDKTGESLVVDGANSVGGDKIKSLKDLCDGLAIEIRNTSRGGSILDQGVGVGFIQEQKIVPSGFGCSDIGFRCASIDGDAGRFLYFSVLPSQEIEIVDGDKILFLFTLYINEQLAALQEVENEKEGHYHARLGILHNAYEIGASIHYLKNLGLDVVSFTPGTRSLHAVASKYDIGIYFEADGCGGILFSENYLLWLEAKNNELLSSSKGSTKQLSISRLLAVSRLMNTTVPDSLASLLMAEAILQHNGWSLQKWNEIYCEQTNMQLNEVELAENIAVAAENPKTLAVSHSGMEGETDTLRVSDEARSENAQHVSHLSQESKNIDEGPTESAGQQAVNYEAHSGEQTHVDVESEQNQKQGTTTNDQACENGIHIGLPQEFQEKQESQVVQLNSDETSDEINLEASSEESQDLCILKREEENNHEFDAEMVVSPESHICPAKVIEADEDPDHVSDKEVSEIKRVEADDDAWVLVSDGKGNSLNPSPTVTDTMDYEHLPELALNGKESYSSPEVNGIHAPVENVDDLLLSADMAKSEGISGPEPASDAQTQSQTSSGLHLLDNRDYEHLPELDDPSKEKESCSSPKADGRHTLVENVGDLPVSVDAEESGAISGLESACDAQPQSQTSSGLHFPELEEPSNDIESFSSPKVNGTHLLFENGNDLLVSADTVEAEDNARSESACDAHLQSQTSNGEIVPSVDVDDEPLETKANNGSVDVDNGSSSLVNGPNLNDVRVSSTLDGNDINAPLDSGEALPIPSDVGTTEETGDLNVVEYASCNIAPSEVNGIVVALPPSEHVAIVEAITNNCPVEIDNESNYLVNGKNSDMRINLPCSDEVNSVETLKYLPTSDVDDTEEVETLKNMSTSDVNDTEEAGSTNDGVEIEQPSNIPCTISSSVVRDNIVGNEAENGGIDVENGDVNLPVDRKEELSDSSGTVQADDAETARHDSELNGAISGLPIVHIAEPESESDNNPTETEATNILDIQPPSQINGISFEPSHHGEIESQAERSLLDALETETITIADVTMPQVQVNSHRDQETYFESEAGNTLVSGDKRSDCLVGSSFNPYLTFGSFPMGECSKSEAPITVSRDVCRDDSAAPNLDEPEANTEVTEASKDFYCQQHVTGNHSEQKVEDTLFRECSDLKPDECAISAVADTEGDISERTVVDGQSVADEIVKKPFYYLIRIPKYDDEKLSEQIKSAEMLLEEKTRNRDASLAEYRQKKENCQKLRANQQAAVLEERAARDLVRAKRKEIDSAQSLVNIAKDAMTIEDLDNKIANMEHTIQHETVSLNEEKKLIREIKQSTKLREQLLATAQKQGFQEALDHKDKNEDHVKVLRKDLDSLRYKLSEAEQATKAVMKILDSEHAKLNELHRQLTLSNDVRQEAYVNLQNLRTQWSEKNKYFWTCKNVQRQANTLAASGDKTSLQSVCANQVESVMKLWNQDNEFRKDYIRCNLRSTLRRLGTADGRSLGPDEEPPSFIMPPPLVRRTNPSVIDTKESNPVAESQKADPNSANKVVEQKKPNVVINNKPKKPSSPFKNEEEEEAQATNTVKIEEDKEAIKARKEQEELARKEEELRKIEEAVKLKEKRRLEEKAKFEEALERKRRNAEKAQAKAELRAKREAEEKEKEREKRAKKKGNKKGRKAEDTTPNPDTETVTTPDAIPEQPKEAETRDKTVSINKRSQKPQYAKQNKLKTILPPPPPLRNRARRRTQQWVWVAVTIVAILVLFFLGNLNLNIPDMSAVFSSWH